MQELASGLWRWTARHAEWHPGEWGAEVASFAVDAGDGAVLLIDPLLPEDDTDVLERLDALSPAAILVTIPYHARSSEPLAERYGIAIHATASPSTVTPRSASGCATAPTCSRSTTCPPAPARIRWASRAGTRRRSICRRTARWCSATRS
jgi:hypothetical protein